MNVREFEKKPLLFRFEIDTFDIFFKRTFVENF